MMPLASASSRVLSSSSPSQSDLLARLAQGDALAFDAIYDNHWQPLYAYVYNRLRTQAVSEDIVQEVFIALWANRQTLLINGRLTDYLFGAVRRQLLHYFRAEQVRDRYVASLTHFSAQLFDDSNAENMALSDLQQAVERSMAALPARCQQVFWLSRRQHLSSAAIAAQLGISARTVENYLTTALQHLRTSLGDFFVLYWLFLVWLHA